MRELSSEIKRSWDLSAIVVLSIALALIIFIFPDSILRIALGLPFILFFPGYALIGTLFPEKSSLDIIERIALSFGLSIAIVPLIGFGLNYTPFGIRLEPILACLLAFDIAFSGLAYYRREKSKEPYLPVQLDTLSGKISMEFGTQKKLDKALTIVLILAIISSVVALTYVVAFPKEGEHFSEFYILGPSGQATGYPTNLSIGEQGSVIMGISNHEYRTVNYTVQVWLANATYSDNTTNVNHLYFMDEFNVVLDHVQPNTNGEWKAEYQQFYNFTIPYAGHYKLWFVLLKDGAAFDGTKITMDYAGSDVATTFVNDISSNDVYTLNLNLDVSS